MGNIEEVELKKEAQRLCTQAEEALFASIQLLCLEIDVVLSS